MELLFISMNPLTFNSSGNLRNISCLKGLCELGHSIDVLTLEADTMGALYDESNSENLNIRKYYYLQQNPLYKRLRSKKNIQVAAPKEGMVSNSSLLSKFLRSVINILFVYDAQIINVRGIKVDGMYDLVISSSDPKSSHILARHIIRKNRLHCPWYQYWGDPMYDDITIRGGRFKRWRLNCAEQKLLSKADRIIYTSPLTCDRQRQLYPREAEKMIYAVQACTKEIPAVSNTFQKEYECVTLGYFGDYHSKIRNIAPLEVAVKSQPMWNLVIAGSGDGGIEAENIRVYPRLSFAEIEELEQETDIMVGVCNIRGTQIPAKLYYMAGTQKPIILIVDGENSAFLRRYFEKYQRYIVCGNEPNEILKAINLAVEQLRSGVSFTLPEEFRPINVANKILEG